MNLNRNQLFSDLLKDEGFKPFLYDDANGHIIGPGSQVVGNPTIGIGWNCSAEPLSMDRAEIILGWFVDDVINALYPAISWISSCPEAIQRVLVDMAYNLGVNGLLKFNTFLGLIRSGKYTEAADDLKTTLWYHQVGDRAKRIESTIRNQNGK